MNTTTNLGLKMPEYSDQADIQDINDNMETLDGKMGAVGNTSVQEQIDAINTKVGSTALPTTAQTLTGAIAELADYADDVIEGYYYNGTFYEESTHTTAIIPSTGKLYIDISGDCTYRWSGTAYVMVGTPIDDEAGTGDTDKTWSADKLSGIGVPTLISGDDYEIAL